MKHVIKEDGKEYKEEFNHSASKGKTFAYLSVSFKGVADKSKSGINDALDAAQQLLNEIRAKHNAD